jgi:hypothetical protein
MINIILTNNFYRLTGLGKFEDLKINKKYGQRPGRF